MSVRSAGDVTIVDDSDERPKKKTIQGVILEGDVEAIRAIAGHVLEEVEVVVEGASSSPPASLVSEEPPPAPAKPDHSEVTARFQRAITDGLREIGRPLISASSDPLDLLKEFADELYRLAAAPYPSDGRVWDDGELRSLAGALDRMHSDLRTRLDDLKDQVRELETQIEDLTEEE